MENTKVQLANGLVVDARRLSGHLQRRCTRVSERVRAPDRFYFCEAAFSAVRSYDVSMAENHSPALFRPPNRAVEATSDVNFLRVRQETKWVAPMTLEDSVTCIERTHNATRRWSLYMRDIDTALRSTEPSQFSAIWALMRKAPDELKDFVQHESPNLLLVIIRFVVVLTSRYPFMSDYETRQTSQMIKTLLKYIIQIRK